VYQRRFPTFPIVGVRVGANVFNRVGDTLGAKLGLKVAFVGELLGLPLDKTNVGAKLDCCVWVMLAEEDVVRAIIVPTRTKQQNKRVANTYFVEENVDFCRLFLSAAFSIGD
jgi:hypothetical protein